MTSASQNIIKTIRLKRQLSQEEMAADLSVSANYISLIENFKKKPGMPFLKKVSVAYQIPLIILAQEYMIPKASTKKEAEMQKRVVNLIADLEQFFLKA